MRELYPCPSCETAPEIEKSGPPRHPKWSVACVNRACLMCVETNWQDTKGKAISVWNAFAERMAPAKQRGAA